MTQGNPKTGKEDPKDPIVESPYKESTRTESSAFGNGSSHDADLKLSEETESKTDSTTTTSGNGNGFDRNLNGTGTADVQGKPDLQVPPDADVAVTLKELFASVDNALIQSAGLPGDIQTLLGGLNRKQIRGSDTRALTDSGDSATGPFTGFTLASTPHGEVITRVYESGSVVTKLANGTEYRFPPSGDFAEVTQSGKEPRRVPRSEANIEIASVQGNGFKVSQKADGTLSVDFDRPQSDGATGMTFFPANPEGLKWTRSIPESDGIPQHTISSRTDRTKTVEFAEPLGAVKLAHSSANGDLLVSLQPDPDVNQEAPPAELFDEAEIVDTESGDDDLTSGDVTVRNPTDEVIAVPETVQPSLESVIDFAPASATTELDPAENSSGETATEPASDTQRLRVFPLEQLPERFLLSDVITSGSDRTQLATLQSASSPLVAMAILEQLERINKLPSSLDAEQSTVRLGLPSLERRPPLGSFGLLGGQGEQQRPTIGNKEEQRLLESLQSATTSDQAMAILTMYNEAHSNTSGNTRLNFDIAPTSDSLDLSVLQLPGSNPDQAIDTMMMAALQEARTTGEFKDIMAYVTRFGVPYMPADNFGAQPLIPELGRDRPIRPRLLLPSSSGTESPYLVNPSPPIVAGDFQLPFLDSRQDNPFEALISLRQESRPSGPLDWHQTVTLIDQMSQAKDLRTAEQNLDALSELAKKGDKHAQAALAATFLSLEGGFAGLAQVHQMNMRDNPIFAPQLHNLSAQDREQLRQRARSELESQTFGSENKPMSKEALAILATTYEIARGSGRTEDADVLAKVIKDSASTDEGVSAFWRLHNRDKPYSDDLMKIFLDGMSQNNHGQFFFESMGRRAAEGDKEDIRLLSLAVSSGELNGNVSTTALEGLRQAAAAGHGDQVVSALQDVYAKHGDNNRLLETLGATAADGGLDDKQFESIKRMLREGVDSTDPEVQSSAVQGILRLPDKWTEADVKVLSENLTPALAEGLKDAVSKLTPERGQQLAQLIEDRLVNNSSTDVKEVTSAVTALGALSDFAGPEAAQAIKTAATDRRFATGPGADQLTRAGVTSLMRMGGSRNPGSETALAALQADGWRTAPGMPMTAEFRKELADFVIGDIARVDMSEAAKRLAYDTGFPQSIHRMFRDQGVSPDVLDKMVDQARTNYDDATIRNVISRAALYNALPEELRSKLFQPERAEGVSDPETPVSAPPINVIQVLGQMSEGTLKDSSNNILLNPVEDKVTEIRDTFAQEQRRVAAMLELNQSSASNELKELTKLTSEGVNTWNYLASWFGDQTLNEFTVKQGTGLINYQSHTEIGKMQQQRLGRLVGVEQALSAATDAFQYEQLKASGNEREADLFAAQMLQQYGPLIRQRAPEVWSDLGMVSESSSLNETVFQRLSREGLGQSPDAPRIRFGSHEGMQDGISILSTNLDETKIDARARTTLALLGIDGDPALSQFTATITDLQARLPALEQLVSAGIQGTRSERYVGGVQEFVQDFQKVYDSMSVKDPVTNLTPAEAARASLNELKLALPSMDPDVRDKINERIVAMEKMLEFLDPNSQSGKDLRLMFDQVNSNDFDESGFINWMKSDGLKTLGAIALGVAAAAAVVTMGPFVIAAAGVAGGIIGYEVMAETLFQLRSFGVVDTGERTGAQTFHAVRGGLNMGADGHAEDATVTGALKQHGLDFLQGTALALATMGAGTILGRAFAGIRGGAGAGLNSNAASFGRLASRVQQVESAAEKVGGKALLQKWMTNFSHEFREEVVEEIMGKSAEAGMEQILGDVNPVLSVLSSAIIANRNLGGGFDVNAHRGGNIEIEVEHGRSTVATMEALQAQLRADGLMTELNGDTMTVTTPEGEVLTLTAKAAGATVDDTASASDTESTTNSDTIVDATTDGAVTVPGTTGGDTVLSDTASTTGDTSPQLTPAMRQEQVQNLVQQLNQANLDPTTKTEIEGQIKEILVEQAKDYARRLGLVTRDSAGNVTGYLINPEQISLVRGKGPASFGWSNEMTINIDDPGMMSTLLHEMRHQKDYYGLTVQRLASEISGDHRFEHRLQEEVFGELLSGDQRMVTSDGEYRVPSGFEKYIPNIKEIIADYKKSIGDKPFNDRDVAEWLAKNHPDVSVPFGPNIEIAQMMLTSIDSHRAAGEGLQERRTELIEHPELRQPLSNLLKDFAASRPDGQATLAEIETFLAGKDLTAFDGAQLNTSDVAKLMDKELDHYRQVLKMSSMTATQGDGNYVEQLQQAMEASGNGALFNEFMRRAQKSAASGNTFELDHLTRGIVDSRLGMAQDPVAYFATSPLENGARLIEATQALSSMIDRRGDVFDSTTDKVAFESRALQFTRAFSRFRTETDPQRQTELWEKAQQAAERYAEKLPDHDVGRQMAQRLLDLGLITEIPPQFTNDISPADLETISDAAAIARLSAHPNEASASLPSMKPSAILDRATSENRIGPKERTLYEQAIANKLLSPKDLSRLLNDVSPHVADNLVPSLLRKGQLTADGLSNLINLSANQLDTLSDEMTPQSLQLYVSMLNNPNVDQLAVSQLLTRSSAERVAYEKILAGPDKMPSAEVIGKLLSLPPSTVTNLEQYISQNSKDTQSANKAREAVLNLVQRRDAGRLAFTAQLFNKANGLDANLVKQVLDRTVESESVKNDPAKLRQADENLTRLTELLQRVSPQDGTALLKSIADGSESMDTVATLSTAMSQGYFGTGGINLDTLLSDTPSNRRAVVQMLELDMAAPKETRLGPGGMQMMGSARRGRVTSAFENNLISPQELRTLLLTGPEGFIVADTILPQSDGPRFSKETVDKYLQAVKEGQLPLSTLESVRQATTTGHLSDRALSNMLSQPKEISAKLFEHFDQLWTERSIRHSSQKEPAKPADFSQREVDAYAERMREFRSLVKDENTRFFDRFVNQLETAPAAPETMDMAELRLRQMDRSTHTIESMEPALIPGSVPISIDGPKSTDLPPEVAAFMDALAKHDYETAIEVAMESRSNHKDQFTPVNLSVNDLDNPSRMQQIIEQMDKIGFAERTSDTSVEGDRGSESRADLAQPILTLPSGVRVDLSGAKIEFSSPPSPQDLALFEQLKNHPSFQMLRGRVALTAYEERLIHNNQGDGGARSELANTFKSSPQYAELEMEMRDKPGKLSEAMREIDVAARFIDAGMSVEDAKRFLGDRHLKGEREFFYRWLESRGG
ncbi:MAG: hypothetical protein SGJ27_21450 [Candidatus Melainabacteria bacterium]|nr:hypothetical protein [Candidatus Melainabacteria bacterium]